MFIKQISVFVENQFGTAADVLNILAQNGINISALSIADTSDYGIMRLIVDNPDKTKELLYETGIMVKCSDVLAIPIDDTPGGLAKIASYFKSGGVSIEYMYAFTDKNHGNAVVVTKTDNPEKAIEVLSENNIKPICSKEIFN